MTRQHFIKLLFLAVLPFCGFSQNSNSNRPNIVFIMSDDHAYQAVSAYGFGFNSTPNIDRLANEGALFTRATVTNSLCAPSRAVILTGKMSHINGKVDIAYSTFDWNQDNFAKDLHGHGYQTAVIGKVHLAGRPQGFDYTAVLPGQGEYYNPDFIINGDTVRLNGYVTDLTTDMTLDWISKRDQTKPFCVLYHQKAPHREWLPALRYIGDYTQKQFKTPATLFDNYEGRGTAAREAEMNIYKYMHWAGDNKVSPKIMDELGLKETSGWGRSAYDKNLGRMSFEQRKTWDSVYNPVMAKFKHDFPGMSQRELMTWRYERYLQDYLGTIAAVDDGVGRLLDFLKENGLEENTIVIYTSDQGFYMGEHGWFDKRFMYEESFRTPLVIRYPKEIKPGQKLDQLVQNLDFAPTLLDYAGVEVPESMQGESFRGLLNDQRKDWRDAVYYSYYAYPAIHQVKRHYGIRTDRYKLIHFYYDTDEWELYDLEKDPQEMRNVYDDPAYAKVKKEMHKKLGELRAKYRDSDENDRWFIKYNNTKPLPRYIFNDKTGN